MTNFQDLVETKKGNIGEELVIESLENKGYTVYTTHRTDRSHPIDLIAIKKNRTYLVDVKCKPRRIKYKDTGFDLADYDHYMKFKENGDCVMIVFVDEITRTIYGGSLDDMPKPSEHNGIVYWDLDEFKTLRDLSEEEVESVKEYTNRSLKYEEVYKNM